MSPLARGIYRELLDAHYADPLCSLPDDDHWLARAAGVALRVWLKVKAEIMPWLPVVSDGPAAGRRQNGRALHEWVEAREGREKNRERTAKARAARHADVTPKSRPVTESVTEATRETASASATASATTDIPPRPPRGGRPTWLTPYGDAWRARYGGEPPWGQIAKALKTEHDRDPARCLAYWTRYLAETEGQFASPARFGATFGDWDPERIATKSLQVSRQAQPRPATPGEKSLATLERIVARERGDGGQA